MQKQVKQLSNSNHIGAHSYNTVVWIILLGKLHGYLFDKDQQFENEP